MDFFNGDCLLFTPKWIVFSEKKHAVTFLALAHWHTGAIPEGLLYFRLLVFIVTAGAEGTTQVVFMASQSLKNNGRNARIAAEIGAGALGIGFGKTPNHLKTL